MCEFVDCKSKFSSLKLTSLYSSSYGIGIGIGSARFFSLALGVAAILLIDVSDSDRSLYAPLF